MSADTAVLLVSKLSRVCGRALTNRISSGRTLAIVRMSCAKEFLSFPHEISHTVGLMHEMEEGARCPTGLEEATIGMAPTETVMAAYSLKEEARHD